MQESRHAQDEEKEDQARHEDPLAAHHHHLRDGRHGPSGRWRERTRNGLRRSNRTNWIPNYEEVSYWDHCSLRMS